MSEAISDVVETQIKTPAPLHLAAPDFLEKMLKADVRKIKAGQFVIMEGEDSDTVICVLGGWLSLSKCLPDGDTQIVDFALPGEIIEAGTAREFGSAVSIEALTDVSLAVVPAHVWEDMKRQRPDLTRIARTVRGAAHARMAGRMLRLGRGKALMRLAYTLLELNVRLEAIGQSRNNSFHIPMNQRVLGDFVGLSSVHVCRTLGQLASKGVIRVVGHMDIEIVEIELLAEMAGVDLDSLPCEILAKIEDSSPAVAHPAHT